MTECEKRIKTYLNPFWSNEDIRIALGCGSTEASKEKQRIVAAGGAVQHHGQKVYRDVACVVLNIDLEREIRLCKLAMEVLNG